MAFSKTISEAFRVTLFNGNCDNNGSKELHIAIGKVSIAQLLTNHLALFLLYQLNNNKILHAPQHCASLHSAIIYIAA